MLSLFLLCFSIGLTSADVPIPDQLKNHYKLIVNTYNTSECDIQPNNVSYLVRECQSNGSNLPYCCVDMLRSLNFVGNENSFNYCLQGYNGTSYFASCEQYYTESQIEYGKVAGYVVLGLVAFLLFLFLLYLVKRCCCRSNEYESFN